MLQVTINCTQDQTELFDQMCEQLEALSVTIIAADEEEIFEPELNTTPLWQQCQIKILFEEGRDISSLIALTKQLDVTLTSEEIEQQDWQNIWRQQFHKTTYGKRITICPSYEAGDQVEPYTIVLDPGLAFGTGKHPTTSLCLKWLDHVIQGGETVIDYGCGSGILALAAAKLGAQKIIAVDIDEQALQATQDNALNNGVTNIETVTPESMPSIKADILIANILCNPLIELAPTLRNLLKDKGNIALSGILPRQVDTILATYQPLFDAQYITTEQGENNDEWVLISNLAFETDSDIISGFGSR